MKNFVQTGLKIVGLSNTLQKKQAVTKQAVTKQAVRPQRQRANTLGIPAFLSDATNKMRTFCGGASHRRELSILSISDKKADKMLSLMTNIGMSTVPAGEPSVLSVSGFIAYIRQECLKFHNSLLFPIAAKNQNYMIIDIDVLILSDLSVMDMEAIHEVCTQLNVFLMCRRLRIKNITGDIDRQALFFSRPPHSHMPAPNDWYKRPMPVADKGCMTVFADEFSADLRSLKYINDIIPPRRRICGFRDIGDRFSLRLSDRRLYIKHEARWNDFSGKSKYVYGMFSYGFLPNKVEHAVIIDMDKEVKNKLFVVSDYSSSDAFTTPHIAIPSEYLSTFPMHHSC